MTSTYSTICVYPSASSIGKRYRAALSQLVSVRFLDHTPEAAVNAAAIVNTSGSMSDLEDLASSGLPCFQFSAPEISTKTEVDSTVRFTRAGLLDTRLAGRSLPHQGRGPFPGIETQPGDEILALWDEKPVWVVRQGDRQSTNIVAVPPAPPSDSGLLYDAMNPRDFMPWIPFLHFLRSVSQYSSQIRPPLRACLMFDDPNLHWTSYGFISYPEVLRRAESDNYHVAFATIPIDSWFSHRKAVELFRNHPNRLSLLFHGNDHLYAELGQTRSLDECLELVASAVHRINRFEASTKLKVARVMAPPHGAYTNTILLALQSLGFEGACISQGSLRGRNKSHPWPDDFGLKPAEMMDRRFPVIPRFRLSEKCEAAIVFAAYMDQPIIPVGHHDTVASGIELLSIVARTINSLGDVCWQSPEMMLRSNYLATIEAGTLWIEPYSGYMSGRLPQAVHRLGIKKEAADSAEFTLVLNGAQHVELVASVPQRTDFSREFELISRTVASIEIENVRMRGPSAWAVTRRVLCEGRDRAMPWFRRFHGKG